MSIEIERPGRVLAVIGTRRLVAAVAAVAAIALSTPLQAETQVTPDSVSHTQHIIDCLKVLFSDPEAHAKYCGPGHEVAVSGSTGFSGDEQ